MSIVIKITVRYIFCVEKETEAFRTYIYTYVCIRIYENYECTYMYQKM